MYKMSRKIQRSDLDMQY